MSAGAVKREVDPITRAAQARASDPKISAWVSANAGSGKTHVLTQRVVRLLLAGADPARILCLTFTKAAAANMSARVFQTLSRWTALDDEKLVAAILATGVSKVEPGDLRFARKLFARTIETPGGLKIETIHAFCERLLHLFPFEANVVAGFRVIEEREAADLMIEARAAAFAAAQTSPKLAAAIERIAADAGADGFERLIGETLRRREEIAAHGGLAPYARRLRARLGLAPGETEATVDREMLEGGGGSRRWRNWARSLASGSKTDKDRAALLEGAATLVGDEAAQLSILLDAFFTQAGPPRKALLTKGVATKFPDLGNELHEEQARLEALRSRRRSAEAFMRSCALMRVAETISSDYAGLKNARGWLDFDDLVARALALLEKADAAWVLYKLDRGIDHFLVDEAQDTSRAQWAILQKLAEEFLSGRGAGGRRRTFFAVGDEKQSIFSFQGAAPAMFDTMRREFQRRHEHAELAFAHVRLNLSFRSAPQLLAGVDRVFSLEQVWRGVSAGEASAPPHGAFHQDLPGLIDVWEPIAPEAIADPEDWVMPLDAAHRRDPAVRLAERVAGVIGDWLSPGSEARVIDAKTRLSRRIGAGDILILVRSRGAFYEAMTRALRRRRIAFAGADRLRLSDHIAAMDLVSAGRAALSRDDDLALAEVLKSPLIGLDDDALIEFAPRRKGSLADALEASRFHEAASRVNLWRERAKTLSPFGFYAALIGADGGRRALIGRLGHEAADAIDEFLALALSFERVTSPALGAFLDEVSASESAIKRDLEAESFEVRVMTVHAAKGLEAPIVILPDTSGAPNGAHDPKWLELEPATLNAPALSVWATKKADDSETLAAARFAAQEAAAGEHRRLLYVAMTRAAQRLIVCGFEGVSGRAQDCWYDLIRAGLDGALEKAAAPWGGGESVWRFGAEAGVGEAAQPAEEAPTAPPADWLFEAAAPETRATALRPSRAAAPSRGNDGAERRARREAGALAHALLQQLPAIPPERRTGAAARFLSAHGAALSEAQRADLAARVVGLIESPELAAIFGPGSRAEVAVTGALARANAPPLAFSGRIDRLTVGEGAIDVVDFKTGAAANAAIRRAHVTQLALYRAALAPLYPGRPIRARLVSWETAEIETLPGAVLDAAIAELVEGSESSP